MFTDRRAVLTESTLTIDAKPAEEIFQVAREMSVRTLLVCRTGASVDTPASSIGF
jgi:hypothetical protein